jgi:hypothetical protein
VPGAACVYPLRQPVASGRTEARKRPTAPEPGTIRLSPRAFGDATLLVWRSTPEEVSVDHTPMQKGAESLRALGRGEMISLALAYLSSHMMACELVGKEKPDHVSEQVISDRVAKLTDTELIALLMPISALGHSD